MAKVINQDENPNRIKIDPSFYLTIGWSGPLKYVPYECSCPLKHRSTLLSWKISSSPTLTPSRVPFRWKVSSVKHAPSWLPLLQYIGRWPIVIIHGRTSRCLFACSKSALTNLTFQGLFENLKIRLVHWYHYPDLLIWTNRGIPDLI